MGDYVFSILEKNELLKLDYLHVKVMRNNMLLCNHRIICGIHNKVETIAAFVKGRINFGPDVVPNLCVVNSEKTGRSFICGKTFILAFEAF